MDYKTALPHYFTATEAAQALGYRDHSYIARQIRDKKIPAYKVGTIWLIPEKWVKDKLKQEPTGQGARGMERN